MSVPGHKRSFKRPLGKGNPIDYRLSEDQTDGAQVIKRRRLAYEKQLNSNQRVPNRSGEGTKLLNEGGKGGGKGGRPLHSR